MRLRCAGMRRCPGIITTKFDSVVHYFITLFNQGTMLYNNEETILIYHFREGSLITKLTLDSKPRNSRLNSPCIDYNDCFGQFCERAFCWVWKNKVLSSL